MHAVHLVGPNIYICEAEFCGKIFNLFDGIGHVVKNQYKVKDDVSGSKLGFTPNTSQYARELPKVRTRPVGRR